MPLASACEPSETHMLLPEIPEQGDFSESEKLFASPAAAQHPSTPTQARPLKLDLCLQAEIDADVKAERKGFPAQSALCIKPYPWDHRVGHAHRAQGEEPGMG